MIDRIAVLQIMTCAALAGLIAWELAPNPVQVTAVPVPAMPALTTSQARSPDPKPADLAHTALEAPLFSPTRRPPSAQQATQVPAEPNVRLSGIVIESDHRLAVFAGVGPGTKPFTRTEGELIDEWRLDSISPQAVSLSGPAGTRVLEPKPDRNLVRAKPSPPVAVQAKGSTNGARIPTRRESEAIARPAQESGAMPPVARPHLPGAAKSP